MIFQPISKLQKLSMGNLVSMVPPEWWKSAKVGKICTEKSNGFANDRAESHEF